MKNDGKESLVKDEEKCIDKDKTIALIVPYIGGGGAERVAADLSIYFSSQNYQVLFFVQRCLPNSEAYPYEGMQIKIPMEYIYQGDNIGNAITVLFKEAKILKQLKRKYAVDISISFMQAANLLNILSRCHDKVIVTLHNVVSKRKDILPSIYHNKWVYRYLYQRADHIVFVSKYCRNDWIRHYKDMCHKTRIIYNPVRKIGNMEKQPGGNTILFLARFDGIKRPWHIIRMFSRVLEKIPDARLLMLGDGLLLQPMKELAGAMNLEDSVSFAGHVDHVGEYLQAAKVLVIASDSEAFPCSVLEAMQYGVPVVANDCPGGIREALGAKKDLIMPGIRKARCGLITPFLDGKRYSASDELSAEEKLMADAVVMLLRDEGLYGQYSRNCMKRAEAFVLERIGFIWEELIN